MAFKPGQAGKSFTEERLTSYAGLTVLWDYLRSQGLGSELNRVFETAKANASRFCTAQLMLAVVLANLSCVRRLCRIATFTQDPLVSHLLGLPKGCR
ncbi:MAG: hypothetical protein LBG47_07990 [Prevotellaceae bacterium]|nr:hypothetical protein [Prevotellaceae bacterium]